MLCSSTTLSMGYKQLKGIPAMTLYIISDAEYSNNGSLSLSISKDKYDLATT